ncbi:MAG: hypothetical protein KC912_03700 [Proteobacteria bacterium]|nr:hypothetical protein [Pseudomonadota bacterium]
MRVVAIVALGALVVGCKQPEPEPEPGTGLYDSGEDPLPGYPSSFEYGKFKASSLVLLPEGEGLDFTGDGEPDNNLPNALIPVDFVMTNVDMSRDGFNETLASAIASNLLNILMLARHEDLILEIDLLGGTTENGYLQVDDISLDTDGTPASTFRGHFDSERKFTGGPDNVYVPMTFFESSGSVLAQVKQAHVWGNLDDNAIDGYIAGVVPARALIDEVIEPTIPEEGFDTDGDGIADITKATIMETVENLADNENIADVELANGERGVSAAFQFVAFQTDFPTPWKE